MTDAIKVVANRLLDGACLIAAYSGCVKNADVSSMLDHGRESARRGRWDATKVYLKIFLNATDNGHVMHDDPLVHALRNIVRHVLLQVISMPEKDRELDRK